MTFTKKPNIPTLLAAGLATAALGTATVVAPAVTPATAIAKKKNKRHKKKRHRGHHKKAKPKRVTVNDYYFSPTKVKIRKGGVVKWVWSKNNIAPHDVHLKKGPKHLKRKRSYSSGTATTNATFRKKFKRPGTYKFICTIHPTMKITVKVKK